MILSIDETNVLFGDDKADSCSDIKMDPLWIIKWIPPEAELFEAGRYVKTNKTVLSRDIVGITKRI